MSSNYGSISDVELTEDHYDFLETAGASFAFMRLLKFDAEAEGIRRHSIRGEIQKYVYYSHLDLDADPEDFQTMGGGFFQKIWDGELFEAFLHADANNKVLMAACFGADEIVDDGIQKGQPAEYARTMVTEAVA